MDLIRFFDVIGPAAVAGLLTIIGALLSAYLNWRNKESARSQREIIDELTKLTASRREEAESVLKMLVTDNVKLGVDPDDVEKIVEAQVQAAIANFSAGAPPPEYEIVESLVNSYHQQALSQAKVQFWFSVVAASVGFIYILYAATLINAGSAVEYLKILPGLIIDAVAALFFKQAEQTRARATELYDRLRQDRQVEKAEAVVASIEDPTIRSAVKAQIALHMAGLTPKEIDLPTFMTPIGGLSPPVDGNSPKNESDEKRRGK
jgi:hypothetical protein